MAEISVGYMGYAKNPQPGVAIERAVPLGYFSIKYGDAFIARVGVKNTSCKAASFDVFIYLKDSDGNWRAYAYSPTPEIGAGEEREILITKVAPDGYLIRIPAYAKASWEGVNAVRGIVWKDGKKLADKEFDAFYAEPDYFSIGYEEHCFCEGIDENGYPKNKKSVFRSDETLYYYVRSLYDRRGYRITFTLHISGYLPWTGYVDIPPKKDWEKVYACFRYDPPLPTGTWEVYTRIAGNDVIKDRATVS